MRRGSSEWMTGLKKRTKTRASCTDSPSAGLETIIHLGKIKLHKGWADSSRVCVSWKSAASERKKRVPGSSPLKCLKLGQKKIPAVAEVKEAIEYFSKNTDRSRELKKTIRGKNSLRLKLSRGHDCIKNKQ